MFSKIDDDDLFELMKEGGDEGSYRKVPSKEERYKEDLEKFKACEFKKERGCTDILWLILYLLFLGSMIFLTNMGLQKGNIDKLLAPIDGDFKFCGIANETEGYNYTEFPQLLITDWTTENVFNVFKSAVCVNQCPNGQEDQVLECQTTSLVTECPTKDDFNVKFDSYMNICIPSEIPDTMKPALNAIKLSFSQSAVGSTVNNI
jgi:solute carrier family 44 protein 1 (choline transporter-like protein)/choline transporter-like protein 2/4/5